MGRYYTGDITGKFWFAAQPSTDGEQFGALPEATRLIRYYADDLTACKAGLDAICQRLGLKLDYSTVYPEDVGSSIVSAKKGDHRAAYASLQLGLKIYQCVKRQGDCRFDAEFDDIE